MRTLLAQLPRTAWHGRTIKEGSKGPIRVELAFVRATPVRDGLPGLRSWAIFRRLPSSQSKTKFYFSNASRRFSSTGNNPYDWDEMACGNGARREVREKPDWIILRRGPGRAGGTTCCNPFWPICFSCANVSYSKKSPALTTSQTYLLAAEVVENEFKHSPDAPAIIRYHQRRNHAEYRSHLKRTRSQLKQTGSKHRKCIVSL